jgi:hypothetical protein
MTLMRSYAFLSLLVATPAFAGDPHPPQLADERRRHQALGYCTPMAVWREGAAPAAHGMWTTLAR